jgi:acetyl esterase/lipase
MLIDANPKRAAGIAVLGTALLLAVPVSAGPSEPDGPKTARLTHSASQSAMYSHLTAEDSFADLLDHPAFDGFSRLLLPRSDVEIDRGAKLKGIGSLLPYHQNVEPSDVLKGINRIIDDSAAGARVFFDFYTDSERRTDPSKTQTGLFFLRGRPGAPFAVIAPGGGFVYVGSVHEGFPYALDINKHGYNAFVLRYRVGQGGLPATQDLAKAISYIVRNADALQVGAEGYSVWGSSAGARMAAAIGTHGVASFGGGAISKPSAVVMAYTGYSESSAHDPPTFAAVGESDGIASPMVMERRVQALRHAGVRVEFHKYPALGHGFGRGTRTSAEGWIDDAVRFWEKARLGRP